MKDNILKWLRFIFLSIPGVFILIFGIIVLLEYLTTKKGVISFVYAIFMPIVGYAMVCIGLKEKQVSAFRKGKFLWLLPIPIIFGSIIFDNILVKFGLGGIGITILLWVLISNYLKKKPS